MITLGEYLVVQSEQKLEIEIQDGFSLQIEGQKIYLYGYEIEKSNLSILKFMKVLSNWCQLNQDNENHLIIYNFYFYLIKFLLNSPKWTIEECLTREYFEFIHYFQSACFFQFQCLLEKIQEFPSINFDLELNLQKLHGEIQKTFELKNERNLRMDYLKRVDVLELENKTLKDEILKDEKEFEDLRKEFLVLQNENQTLKNETLQDETLKKVEIYEKEIENLRKEFLVLQNENQTLKDENKTLKDEILKKGKINENDFENVKREFLKLKKVKDKEVKQLKENILTQEEMMMGMHANLKVKNERIEILEKSKFKLEEENVKLLKKEKAMSSLLLKNMNESRKLKEVNLSSILYSLGKFTSPQLKEELELILDGVKFLILYEICKTSECTLKNQNHNYEQIMFYLGDTPKEQTNEISNQMIKTYQNWVSIRDFVDPAYEKINNVWEYTVTNKENKNYLPTFMEAVQDFFYSEK